jgi:outer membrane protein OmpA-like peptidoglycan-associated protein
MHPQCMKYGGSPDDHRLNRNPHNRHAMHSRHRTVAILVAVSTISTQLVVTGQQSATTLPLPDPAKLTRTETDLNLSPPAPVATTGGLTRGLTRGAPSAPPRSAETLAGGFRLCGFAVRGDVRGGLPPPLVDYKPDTTADMGRLTSDENGRTKEGVAQAIAAAASLEKVTLVVDANSQSKLDDIQFNLDSADFTDRDKALGDLAVIVALMQKHPEAKLLIRGHTCDLGDDRYNLVLSCLRANKVHAWLTANGVAADRLDPVGYGEQFPARLIDPEASEAMKEGNRRANRRVFFQLQIGSHAPQ